MLTLAVALAVTAAQPVAPSPAETPPEAADAPRPLDDVRQVAALCDTLSPFDHLPWKGDVVARGRAETAHDARRATALDARYRVRVASARLAFGDYDDEEQQLTLSDRAFLAGAANSLWLWTVSATGLPVSADPATAERIVKAAQRGALALVLTFTLPDDDDEDVSCGHVAGTGKYTLGVEPYRWEYVEGDQVLARGGEGSDRPLVTFAQGAVPRVEISAPVSEQGDGVLGALQKHRGELRTCYVDALKRNPALDGAYVADVDGTAGAAKVRLAADSVQDDGMASCVTGVLARVDFPAARAVIPIHFDLEAPGAAAQQGTGAGE